jgi:V/A-type H+-transporting ATPase subunit K
MISSILWSLPVIAVVFVVTTAALRRAPARGYRRLLAVNGALLLGGAALGALLLLGVVERAGRDAGTSVPGCIAGAGIAVAGPRSERLRGRLYGRRRSRCVSEAGDVRSARVRGLAEGIAIYGLVIAIILIGQA